MNKLFILLVLVSLISCVSLDRKPEPIKKRYNTCAEKMDKCIKSYLDYGLEVNDAITICKNIHSECVK